MKLKLTKVAQSFNEFFVGIGNMVEAKVPKGKKHFSDFLSNSSPNSISLKPIDIDEVFIEVKIFKDLWSQ